MSREELVERYLDGQLSRRVFIRRLVATGVATATALTYASLLESLPADAVATNFYLPIVDFAFTANPAKLAFGQNVSFVNHSRVFRHSAKDSTGMGLFDTGPILRQGYAVVTVPSAGTYPYKCAETTTATHPAMTAQLKAPVKVTPASGTTATSFTVRWALNALPSGYVVDVQRREPGSTTWTDWKTGVTTRSTTFTTTRRGTWSFRARLRRVSNAKASGWSAATSITVS